MSLEKATWGNLTELNRDYYASTIRPWLEKIEAEFEKKLLTEEEQDKYYIEFDTSEFSRVDQPARYTAYQTAITSGWLTKDEVRSMENLPPLPEEESAPLPVAPLVPTNPPEDNGGNPDANLNP